MGFTNVVVSLRAPRATVAIPNDDRCWPFFARRALEFLSQTRGGARGTILPLAPAGAHPAVIRLLRRYDPDHLLPLMASLTDLEEIRPGVQSLLVDGKPVPPKKRRDFIRRVEEHGPHLMRLLSEEQVSDARGQLNTFLKDDGHPRVHAVHPLQTPDRLLGLAAGPTGGAVNFETGDPLLDLAVGLHRGIAASPTEVRRLAQGDLTRFQVSSAIVPTDRASPAPQLPMPADATVAGLSEITMGSDRDRGPLVVLGRTADDFALALAWGHFAGHVVWLPVTRSQTTWLADLGTAVDRARRYGSELIQVTSVSLSDSQCGDLMSALWAARLVRGVDDEPDPWAYVDPFALEPMARTDLRLEERWDQRFALPTSCDEAGAHSMATRFPLTSPVDGSRHGQWIVDVVADRAPILSFAGFPSERLLAPEQNRWETFVRASGTGISFESRRWGLVDAGASPYGQLAQPQLRWPSLHEMLDAAARRTGNGVRTSAPGYLGRLVAGLFGGRPALTMNLHGPARAVLDQFVETPKNGPLTAGGIGLHGSVFVAFAELAQRVSAMNQDELRSWLDDQVKLGVVRVGHILDCEVCHWRDFYVLADVGSTFACKRCATPNHLTVKRWRMPIDGASWFYDLHPAVTSFLRDHGDVPLLAVQALTHTGMRPVSTEFEFEILAADIDKSIAEIDFAFVSRDRLVIGEAKSNGALDGRNRTERVRDARKLITAADILGASEICYASATTWSQSTWEAIRDAATASRTHVTIAVAENVSTPTAATRTVLTNPTGAGG